MTFKHGRLCQVVASATEVTGVFKDAKLDAKVDTGDVSTFGNAWKAYVVGQATTSLTLQGYYDPTQEPTIDALVAVTAPFVLTVGPAGLNVGDMARLVQGESTSVETSSPVGGAVLLNWDVTSTQEVGMQGWCVSSPAVGLSGTSTGAVVDTGAAVNGAIWVAHFHLSAISATNILMTIQDSADGSTGWANITGVTSGTLTATGAVRVTGVGNVRRYVRASYTITGGAATATVTAAIARRA